MLIILLFPLVSMFAQEPIIIDHTCTDIFRIPDYWIQQAKENLRVGYGHTSHGSQLVTGIEAYRDKGGQLYSYSFSSYGLVPGKFLNDLWGNAGGANDLGHNGDLGWRNATVTMLNKSNNDRNVVMWSWCGGVSDNTHAGIKTYLDAMAALEFKYPDVTFIYMTGHLDGSYVTGNLNIRNEQIRAYCRANNKVLFDFADIESYDPDGNYFLDRRGDDNCDYKGGNWAIEWMAANPNSELAKIANVCGSCSHSQRLNCVLKGGAFWWMMARIAGWEGDSDERTLRLVSPNGGEKWLTGSKHNITWKSKGEVGKIGLEYSLNSGQEWEKITSSTKNDGTFSWKIPSKESKNCLVRINEANGYLSDTNNKHFSIISADNPPTVRITYPGNNASVKGTVTIRTEAADDNGIKQLDFYINGALSHTDNSRPYNYIWDSTLSPGGATSISVVATDSNNQQATFAISVNVTNVVLTLQGVRAEEKAWLIKKEYGRLSISTDNNDASTIAAYVIYRKATGGVFQVLREISFSDASGGNFLYRDQYLDTNLSYTYRIDAFDTGRNRLAASNEITI